MYIMSFFLPTEEMRSEKEKYQEFMHLNIVPLSYSPVFKQYVKKVSKYLAKSLKAKFLCIYNIK